MNQTQVEIVRDCLISGIKIDRVMMWDQYKIADLRSRLSDVKRLYNIVPNRATKPGKKYRQYWVENKVSI